MGWPGPAPAKVTTRRDAPSDQFGMRGLPFRTLLRTALIHFTIVTRIGEALNPGPAVLYDATQEDGIDNIDDCADFFDDWHAPHPVPNTPFTHPPDDVWCDLEADDEIKAALVSQSDDGADTETHDYTHCQPYVQEVGDRMGYSSDEMRRMIKAELEWERVLAEGSSHFGPLPESLNIVAPVRNEDGGIVVPRGQVEEWDREREAMSAALADKCKQASRAYDIRMAAERAQRDANKRSKGHSSSAAKPAPEDPIDGFPTPPRIEEEDDAIDHPFTATGGGDDQGVAARVPSLRGPRNRPRGRRRRSNNDSVEVWTLNSSGRPQLLAAVAAAQSAGGGRVCAILSQEHQARDAAIADLQADVGKYSWRIAVASATRGGGGGASAGVGVATPRHVPSGLRPGWSSDASPKAHPGRICIHWVQAVVPCGMLCISVYFYHTEGASPRNLSLLDHALAKARASECLWCLALDANQTPSELLAWAAPMVHMSNGKVLAPDVPTHYPAVGEARTIDFFIVHATLAAAVESVEVVDLAAAKPHRAVSLKLKACHIPRMQTTIRAPRRFPRHRPVGCGRSPVAPAEGYTKVISDAADTEELITAVDDCWSSFVSAMEAELCGLTDAWRGNAPDQRWCGRSHGVDFVQTPVLPSRSSREMGKVDQRGQTYLWAENRLRELAVLAQHARSHGPLTGARRRQWSSIVGKLTAPKSAITHVRQEDEQWGMLARRLKMYEGEPSSAVEFLTISANWSHALVLRRKKSREAELAKSWAAFKREQCSNGAGVLHALTKRVQDWPDVVVEVMGRATAAPQDVVDADLASWKSIWLRLAHLSSAPWRAPGPTSSPPVPTRPPPTPAAQRKAAATFKERTGIGVDGVAPRHYGWLSDTLLARLGELMAALMTAGIWPRQVSAAILHLIPKATGGRRPIGVLASFVRLWERTLQPALEDWRLTNR